MLDGKSSRPAAALTLLHTLDLLPVVFGVQPSDTSVTITPPLPQVGTTAAMHILYSSC
jgi:hypothetical protein